jgi:hypothetical protein
MGFLPKKWLRALWGVTQPTAKIAAPINCDACVAARAAGLDACPEHGVKHPRPHTYRMGHEVDWGGVFDNPDNSYPRSSRPSVER